MTDKMTPGMLRDLADLCAGSGRIIHQDIQSVLREDTYGALAQTLRDEAARREAVGQKVCRYGNDCPDVGGPCPSCDGTGAQDDGDPEVGQMMIDCDRCKGTGKTAADLVARIDKAIASGNTQANACEVALLRDCRAAIEALRAREKALEGALAPFARVAEKMTEHEPSDLIFDGGNAEADCVRVMAFREAAAALAQSDGEAKCETHGHIFGHRSACMFCGAPKPALAAGGADA